MAANRLLTLVWNQAGLMPLDRVYREIRTMLDAREVGAPRHFRRVIMRQREKMTKVLADCHAMIDRKFEEITRNYDPETGTLDGVQEEAEAMIAGEALGNG